MRYIVYASLPDLMPPMPIASLPCLRLARWVAWIAHTVSRMDCDVRATEGNP